MTSKIALDTKQAPVAANNSWLSCRTSSTTAPRSTGSSPTSSTRAGRDPDGQERRRLQPSLEPPADGYKEATWRWPTGADGVSGSQFFLVVSKSGAEGRNDARQVLHPRPHGRGRVEGREEDQHVRQRRRCSRHADPAPTTRRPIRRRRDRSPRRSDTILRADPSRGPSAGIRRPPVRRRTTVHELRTHGTADRPGDRPAAVRLHQAAAARPIAGPGVEGIQGRPEPRPPTARSRCRSQARWSGGGEAAWPGLGG